MNTAVAINSEINPIRIPIVHRCLVREGYVEQCHVFDAFINIRGTEFGVHIHDFGSSHWVAHHIGMDVSYLARSGFTPG